MIKKVIELLRIGHDAINAQGKVLDMNNTLVIK